MASKPNMDQLIAEGVSRLKLGPLTYKMVPRRCETCFHWGTRKDGLAHLPWRTCYAVDWKPDTMAIMGTMCPQYEKASAWHRRYAKMPSPSDVVV